MPVDAVWAVHRLGWLTHRSGDRRRWLAMITYLDESVAGRPPLDVLAVGCVVGAENAWERFAGDIVPLLDELGVNDLHRTDLVARPPRKAFEGWAPERCDSIISQVDDFIVARPLQCLGGAAPMWAWRRATRPKERRRKFPYRMATLHCFEAALEQVYDFAKGRLRPGERVSCVYESNPITDAEVKKAYLNYLDTKPGWRDVFSSVIAFAEKGSRAVGLQAADAVAYESSRLLHTWLVAPHRPARPLLRRLQRLKRYDAIFFDDARKIHELGRRKLAEHIANRLSSSTGKQYVPATRVVSSDSLLAAAVPRVGARPRRS